MALKPTIYKLKIALADLNKDYYNTLNLTVAQHPSETQERMLARIMAYCLHASNDPSQLLSFTKGLSSVDEPDIWLKGLDDQLHLWIDVGEPNFDRIKKACRLAKATYVYSFNSKSQVWWKQSEAQFSGLPVQVFQFKWDEIQVFAQHITRTMDISISLSGETAYVALPNNQLELTWTQLQGES